MSQACTWMLSEPNCASCPTFTVSSAFCAFTLSSTCNCAVPCGSQVGCIGCGAAGGAGCGGGLRLIRRPLLLQRMAATVASS